MVALHCGGDQLCVRRALEAPLILVDVVQVPSLRDDVPPGQKRAGLGLLRLLAHEVAALASLLVGLAARASRASSGQVRATDHGGPEAARGRHWCKSIES